MKLNTILSRLWDCYSKENLSVRKIHDLFTSRGETVVNDHIAFRTIDTESLNIDVIAKPFTENGYVEKGEYHFKDKHLYARHFEHAGAGNYPRIFISQLKLEECSSELSGVLKDGSNYNAGINLPVDELILSGRLFKSISYKVYLDLLAESEYAAWFYVFGFRANHFTISVNSLKHTPSIKEVNDLLKEQGFRLNVSGGEIKGSESDLLQQSSTVADIVPVQFEEGVYNIPCCYYEFAQRFPASDGKLYSGFIAASADRIFESTNYRKE